MRNSAYARIFIAFAAVFFIFAAAPVLAEAEGRAGEEEAAPVIVSNGEELRRYLRVETLLNQSGSSEFQAALSFINDGERPVRVTGLDKPANIELLDRDLAPCSSSPALPLESARASDIVIFPNSVNMLTFTFTEVRGKPALLRLFDQLYRMDLI